MLSSSPPAIRASRIWAEASDDDRPRLLRRATMACPARVVAMVATALLEVEAGDRPSPQLERLCHPTLWPTLDQRLSRRGGPRVTCDSLRRVLIQEQRPGLVQGVAVLQRGCRVEPVAMRLDATTSGWQLTELQYAPTIRPRRRAGVVA